MLRLFAHAGQPPAPHDLWRAWNADLVLVVGFLVVVCAYRRGLTRRPRRALDTWRARSFAAALVALGVALLSPLDALSRALASAHMVQHLLLILVAAPLLALSAPSSTLLRGSPLTVRRAVGRLGRRIRPRAIGVVRHPAAVWLLYVGTLWLWHAATPYGAALEHEAVHVLEHVSFLLAAVLFWHLVVGPRGAARGAGRSAGGATVSPGLGVLLVFATALQSVFLSLLLTFARTPWYGGYATTTSAWGLEPLADQQLAGVIMWIPAGMVYLATALALLVSWVRGTERDDVDTLASAVQP